MALEASSGGSAGLPVTGSPEYSWDSFWQSVILKGTNNFGHAIKHWGDGGDFWTGISYLFSFGGGDSSDSAEIEVIKKYGKYVLIGFGVVLVIALLK